MKEDAGWENRPSSGRQKYKALRENLKMISMSWSLMPKLNFLKLTSLYL